MARRQKFPSALIYSWFDWELSNAKARSVISTKASPEEVSFKHFPSKRLQLDDNLFIFGNFPPASLKSEIKTARVHFSAFACNGCESPTAQFYRYCSFSPSENRKGKKAKISRRKMSENSSQTCENAAQME